MSTFTESINYGIHNEEAKRVWDAYNCGHPIRVPVILGVNPRVWLLNPELNTDGITFKDYSENPDAMVRIQLLTQHYIRHNLLQDAEMGLPKEGWHVSVDLQNYYEAAWFGAEVEYRDGQVPDTRAILSDDNKRMLFDLGFPDPCSGGCMAQGWRIYEHIKEHLANYSHAGLPVLGVSPPSGLGTDGPMTVACSLRGATEMCIELYEDPDFAHELLRYITEATICRIKMLRKKLNIEMKPKNWGFADDSIELLSTEQYREFVLPYHRMLIEELAGEGPHGIHLCGNVQRHMPVLKKELNIRSWDAGFPMDYRRAREELGPDVQINTGPKVSLLISATAAEVDAECKAILKSGIMEGGKFVLREANNLSPCTPVENITAMYQAAIKYGKYL